MERFACKSGMANQRSTPSPERLAELGITTPEQLHLEVSSICAAAKSLSEGGWVTLPFCNTLCGEGLGAQPHLSLEGARVREPAYKKVEELPEAPNWEFPRMQAMLSAMDTLRQEGFPISYEIEGHFTLLNALLPMGRMFATLRKPAGAELMTWTEGWIRQYARTAVEHGATLLSFSDPVATVDILGEKVFREIYLPSCQRLITHLRQDNPGVVIHLCGKLTQSLLDTGTGQLERWEPDTPAEHYGQALLAYGRSHPEGGVIGHFCLNLLRAKRGWVYEVKW